MNIRQQIGLILMAPGIILLTLTMVQVYRLDKKVFWVAIAGGVVGYALFQGYLFLTQ